MTLNQSSNASINDKIMWQTENFTIFQEFCYKTIQFFLTLKIKSAAI